MSEQTEGTNHVAAVIGIIDQGLSLAGALVPQYRVYLLLGAAVARQLPEVYADILRLLEKGEPTTAEKVELWRKLRALEQPETIKEQR